MISGSYNLSPLPSNPTGLNLAYTPIYPLTIPPEAFSSTLNGVSIPLTDVIEDIVNTDRTCRTLEMP